MNPRFVKGAYYHIYNRGVEKRKTFIVKQDYLRFLETINYYHRSPQHTKLSDFRRSKIKYEKIIDQKQLVKILCYCLMPNHFHLLVQQLEDGGITELMRKLGDSYTRFFNTKYERVGSLFQGVFKAKMVESDEYLLQLSKYIHRNSFPLVEWEGTVYPYSSYDYYLTKKPHPFCNTEFILSYFSSNLGNDYESFVEGVDVIDQNIHDLFIDPD